MELDLTSDFLGVTEFRSVIRETLERIEQTRRPLVLTKAGKPSAVVLEVSLFQELCDALKQAEHQALVESFQRAQADVTAGRTRPHEEATQEFEKRRQRKKDRAKNKT